MAVCADVWRARPPVTARTSSRGRQALFSLLSPVGSMAHTCIHPNGLALVDEHPTYVTALGETDTPGGWRAHKVAGGVLMDVPHNTVVCRGLSMPHSPRWYQGRLWLLESGQGRLAAVDTAAGTWQTVVQLPGYTRGLDFAGPLAFVGLSQVREHAVFSGIPLVERLAERACGVWVVHLETGQTVGFVRFEAGVQEIFAVHVLHGIRFPEVLEWDDAHLAHSYMLPDEAVVDVPPLDEAVAQAAADGMGPTASDLTC